MNSEPNVPARVMRLVLLAQPYVGTDWVDLGTEEEEVPVQQGGTWRETGIIIFLLQGRDEVEQGGREEK